MMYRKFRIFLSFFVATAISTGFVTALSNSTVRAKQIEPPPSRASMQNERLSLPTSSTSIPQTALVHAVGSDPQTLDPALAYDTASGAVLMQIYEPLIELNREKIDEFVPLLSTGWTISSNGRTYTFYIRPGVKFHNGNTLTASDVAYSFQRGILQGGSFSPQWLLTEPIFGPGITDVCDLLDPSVCDSRSALQAYRNNHSTKVANVCTTLKSKIVADDVNGTVTFNLDQAWGPFLNTLAGHWGSVIDREWAIQQGAWDGDCNTWHNYYFVTNASSPLTSITNGSGPFKLHHWVKNTELVLNRNEGYWNTVPLWPGGTFGPAAFETVTRTVVSDNGERAQMLLDGLADLIDGGTGFYTEFDAATLFHYEQSEGVIPALVYPDGILKKYTGGLATSALDGFFNFNIATGGPRNYIGSGTWDGNGIPMDFFSDIHVRKGFNYAFDWDEYNTLFSGAGIQRTGPIIKPLPGYAEGQSVYSHNPTLALQELNQAWSGSVAAHGFSLTLVYNSGNAGGQKAAEILKANIEALDPRFHIGIIALDWGEFSYEQARGRLPIFFTGWAQDFPHPHNWVVPYLDGLYANRQNFPALMREQYHTMIYNCLELTGDAARTCYEAIQNQTYLDALDIFLLQSRQRTYISANLFGYYLNPGRSSVRYYDLYKQPLPTTVTVEPGTAQTLDFDPSGDSNASAEFPAGSVAEEIQIVAIPEVRMFNNSPTVMLSNIVFELAAFLPDGTLIPDMNFTNPVTITITYEAGVFTPEQEEQLMFVTWDGNDWVDAACGPYQRDLVNHTLTTRICHLSIFGVAQPSLPLFLPIISR